MKKHTKSVLILLFPFLVMILINESARPFVKDKSYFLQGVKTINSAEYFSNKCSWVCHNNTKYCKLHHVKYLKPFYKVTDMFYFGVIALLASTGSYGAANIVFLVFLFPLTILYFIIKSIQMQDEIRKLSK